MHTPVEHPDVLATSLARWVDAGLISPAQAGSIERWEAALSSSGPDEPAAAAAQQAAPRRSVAVEALAYLGGAIIVAALIVVTVGYWHLLGQAARIAIPAASTVVLVLAGLLVPQRLGPTASRVRSVLWLVSAGTLALLMIIATDALAVAGSTALLLTAGALTVFTLAVWAAHRMAAQQLAGFASAELLAVAIALRLPGDDTGTAAGVALAVLAATWGVLAWQGVLPGGGRWLDRMGHPADGDRWRSGASQRRWGLGMAASGASLGAVILAAQQDRPWLGTIVVALVVAAALALVDLLVLGIGAAATLVTLPMVAGHYFTSTVAMALVLLAAGAVLVGVAVLVARHRTASRDPRSGDSRAI